MVARERQSRESSGGQWEEDYCLQLAAADMQPAGQANLKPACELEHLHVCALCSTSGTVKIGSASSTEKLQARKKHMGGPSAAEVRLIKKYLQSAARPLEEGIDEEALRNLVNSSTFRKFVHRSNLEEEVRVLHQQLQQEVELHTSLERALAHASGALPNTVPRHLPVNAQRLLSDIAMLEVAVLKLETQTTALQWELVHERTEREVIEHCLNQPLDAALQPRLTPQANLASSSNTATLQPGSRSPKRESQSLKPNSPATSTPPTIKELLRTPCPALQETSVPPKSPARRGLRSLWSSGQDSLSSSSPPRRPFSEKDRSSMSPRRITFPTTPASTDRTSASAKEQRAQMKCFSSPLKLHPLFSSTSSSSPITPAEQPRPTSPVTPEELGAAPAPELRLKDLPKLLPSAKRLAFWNFASDDDASSQAESAITSFEFVVQQTSPPNDDDDYSPSLGEKRSLYRSGVLRMRELRSRTAAGPDSSPPPTTTTMTTSSSSDRSTTTPSTSASSNSDSFFAERPRQRPSRRSPHMESGPMWTEPPTDPNRLSEEMVRCMTDIYSHLAEPGGGPNGPPGCPLSPSSHTGHLSSASSLSEESFSPCPAAARSPPSVDPGQRHRDVMGCEASPDPYKALGKLPWADIGPYGRALEVPWLSVGKEQLEYVAHALAKFRLLVEQLAQVDPSGMPHEQKLAFWINLYNALLMHAFLAYGIPRSDLKFFTLMQKAAYCVGGHWFNAAVIEYCLLKGKVMAHRPQFALMMALHKNKLTEEQSKYGIDRVESKVNFALSCGARSSPMVRIYTPEHIHEELDAAFEDYVRASVGLTTKGKLLLPKLVYNYARDFVEDGALLDWVGHLLPTAQVGVLYECVQQFPSHRRRRLLSSPNFVVVPFNFTFRYLFPAGASKTTYRA